MSAKSLCTEAFCGFFGIHTEAQTKSSKERIKRSKNSKKHPLAFEEHCYDSFYQELDSPNGGSK